MTEASTASPAAPPSGAPTVTARVCLAFAFGCSSLAVLVGLPNSEAAWSPAVQVWLWALYSVGLAMFYFVGFGMVRPASRRRWRAAATVVAAACVAVVVIAYGSPAEIPIMMVFGYAVVAAMLGAWALFPGWSLWRRHLVR